MRRPEKFVFIGLDSIENKYLYGGFDTHAYSVAVFLPNTIRKVAKAHTLYCCSDNRLTAAVSMSYFSSCIGGRVKQKGWENKDNICFIVYSRDYESYGDILVKYLREEYSNCSIVCYFVDLVRVHHVDIHHVKTIFDAVFTFDQGEAEIYGINWCLEPFSVSRLSRINLDLPMKWDVSLVAAAKDRLDMIIELYEAFRQNGLICDFHIARAPKEKRLYKDEIDYAPLGFEDLIRHVVQSKCVIELVQDGEYSTTTRFSEALLFGKMLLTNAPCLKEKAAEYDNIVYFEKIEDIPFERICHRVEYDREKYVRMLSNKQMMKTICGAFAKNKLF